MTFANAAQYAVERALALPRTAMAVVQELGPVHTDAGVDVVITDSVEETLTHLGRR